MRDPDRIPKFLDALQAYWEQHPDLRFWQVVEIVRFELSLADPFYIEDNVTEAVIVRLGVGSQDRRRK